MIKRKLYLPVTNLKDPFFRHSGDTFRELAREWEKDGLVEIHSTENGYTWLDNVESRNGVLLYDRPTMEWWKRSPPTLFKMALFGNEIPKEFPRAYPWTFWGRRPSLLAVLENQEMKDYHARLVNCVFIGKIENQVQLKFRDASVWERVVDHFRLVRGVSTKYPYTQSEYLQHLSNARFGLCLRGYGPKCNREIELMCVGTVPIVTPDVDMNGYFDPPREGVHYLIASKPDDVLKIIKDTTPQKWGEMSRNCRNWYMRNASSKGSFYQTVRLVETISSIAEPNKSLPMRSAFSVGPKLPNKRRIVIDLVFFERSFSGITRVWSGLLSELSRHVNEDYDIVLLLREKCNHISPEILQHFSFVGAVPSFTYASPIIEDINMINSVCEKLHADLFISTYYTYSTTTPCLAWIHDMIPERFKMPKDAMWSQKTACIQNAQFFACVSNSTQADLKRFTSENVKSWIVPNAFDPAIFNGVDEILSNPELAIRALKAELGVSSPFVLVIAGNANGYKNMKLINDAFRINPNLLKRHSLVVVSTVTSLKFPEGVSVKMIASVTDRQLGMLYGLASAIVYPSRWEGFGLPILEAFWSETPVICCSGAGAVPEVGGDACWYVNPDRPDELCKTLTHVLFDTSRDEYMEKSRLGLKSVAHYNIDSQHNAWNACINEIFKKELIISKAPIMSSTTTQQPTTPIPTAVPFEGIHMIVQYFHCQDGDRQSEYDYCVQANLENPNVAKLHCLIEPNTDAPEWLRTHAKYVECRIPGRLSYHAAFEYANTHLAGKIVALSNLDIFLDHTSDWKLISGLLDMSIVMCLSRHEFDGEISKKDPKLINLAYANAQDCWVFKAPIYVQDCKFSIGMLGCDNAIAHRLHASGYHPINASEEFKIHHFDICRGKTGENYTDFHKANPEHPELRGQRMVPIYGAISSADKLMNDLGFGDIPRYLTICDIMSKMKVQNP